MLTNAPSDSTIKRVIAEAVRKELILVHGKGPATKYSLSPQAHVTMPLDLNTYFKDDVVESCSQAIHLLMMEPDWNVCSKCMRR